MHDAIKDLVKKYEDAMDSNHETIARLQVENSEITKILNELRSLR